MHDARQLGAVQKTAGVEADQDGSRGFLLLPEKPVLVWAAPSARAHFAPTTGPGWTASAPPSSPRWKLSRSWNCVHAEAVGLHQLGNPTPSPWASLAMPGADARRAPGRREPESPPRHRLCACRAHSSATAGPRWRRHPCPTNSRTTPGSPAGGPIPLLRWMAATSSATPTPRRIRCARSMADSRCSHVGLAGGVKGASTTADILLSSMAGLARILA